MPLLYDVDGAETNKELAYLINAMIETLAKACKQHECWLIHISTDYVFDGALNRPYSPKDTPNPLNVYGASKLAGEKTIQAVGVSIRLCVHLGYIHYGENFYTKIQSQISDGKSLRVTASQKGCPTRANI